jgi:hypothetical protein
MQITQWFHKDCFFKRHKPENTDIITNFKKLKNDDQMYIKANIGVEPTKTAEKKGSAEDDGNLMSFFLKRKSYNLIFCFSVYSRRRK